jgi:hypothetical protein
VADFAAILTAVQPADDGKWKWTWRWGTLRAGQSYGTFTAAAEALEAYITHLMESAGVERQQRFRTARGDE